MRRRGCARYRSRVPAHGTRRVRAQYCGDKELPLGAMTPGARDQRKASHCFPRILRSDSQKGRPEEVWEEDTGSSQVSTPCPCPSSCPFRPRPHALYKRNPFTLWNQLLSLCLSLTPRTQLPHTFKHLCLHFVSEA